VQLAAMGSGQQVSVVPVLSPFGLWPSLIFLWGTAGLQGYLSPAIVSVSVVSSLLWAAIMLRVWNARPTVPWASPRRTGPQSPLVWSALGAWLPTTAIGGSCCASPPIAFSVLGVILPNTAATVTGIELGGVAIPGVLYLLYFGTLLFLQRRSEPLSERCRQ
jgi:disulfide bond formation protein DsbB